MSDDPPEYPVIKIITAAPLQDMIRLYKEAGWWKNSYEKNPRFLEDIVEKSALFAGAFLGERLIGMGRALSDTVSDAYIQDVVVLKKYRQKGIGKKIIGLLTRVLKNSGVDWIGLVAEPGTTKFYEQIGFAPLKGHIALKYKDD